MSNIHEIGENCLALIKRASFFPYKSGKLKNEATNGFLVDANTYCIRFDSTVAPYVEYLEEGTRAHDIPFAFVGKGNWRWWYPYKDDIPFLFGMGGRFNGKFHPGSTKHKGFIKDKSVNAIVNYLKTTLKGEIK